MHLFSPNPVLNSVARRLFATVILLGENCITAAVNS
jgi:hypothetical protein